MASREEESKIFQAATQKNAPMARFFVKGPAEEKKIKKIVNPHLEYVESNLKSYFGTKVKLKEKNGKGQIIIDYMTMDDLNRLLEMMGLE